jgi:outer membrane protein TolC
MRALTNRVYINLALGIVLLFSGTLLGQEIGPTLSKAEAFEQMLESNFGIQIARNNVTIAENNKSILNANYLPSLTGLAGATYDNTSSVTDFNGATDNQGNPRPDIEINDAETRRYNASLNLDYTLFDGLGRYYNFKQLKETYNLSQLEARETIELTTIQLFTVYYEVARVTENVEVLQQTLEISRNREQRAAYEFEYGQSNKLNVLNAQVDVTTDSINLLNALQRLKNVKRDLNVVLNRDLETQFEVETDVDFVEVLVAEEMDDLASANNVTLLQAEKDILISDYAIKSARSLLLPSIGLTGSYGWNRNENPASAFFPGTTNMSNSYNIGASLRWNIFDGGRSITAVKNAKIFYNNQELIKEQLEQQVYRDIANAKGNYINALEVYRLQEQNVVTAEDNFRRSAEQLKIGQITNIEFRQAQVNLLNAQTTKNAAKFAAKVAELNYLQLVGQLLNVDF